MPWERPKEIEKRPKKNNKENKIKKYIYDTYSYASGMISELHWVGEKKQSTEENVRKVICIL